METEKKKVDGFRFMPPKLSAWIKTFVNTGPFEGSIPFHPLTKPLSEARMSLVTTAGISLKYDPPFDMEREKIEATWGDPTSRFIPKGTASGDVNVNHLHINREPIQQDLNVILPLDRMAEFAQEGIIGDLAPTAYSFYGFQWSSNDFLKTGIRPMIQQMKAEAVDAVLLTPA